MWQQTFLLMALNVQLCSQKVYLLRLSRTLFGLSPLPPLVRGIHHLVVRALYLTCEVLGALIDTPGWKKEGNQGGRLLLKTKPNQTKPQTISRNCLMFHWPVLCHVFMPLVCTDRSSVSSWEYCHTELSRSIHYLERRKEGLKESSQQCLTHGFPISVLMCICARKYTSSIK